MLVAAFAGVVLSFTASAIAAEVSKAEIHSVAASITENASSSVLRLNEFRTQLRLLREVLDAPDGEGKDAAWKGTQAVRDRLGALWLTYQNLPAYPGEVDHWPRVTRALSDLDLILGPVLTMAHDRRMVGRARSVLEAALTAADEGAIALVQINANQAAALGDRVRVLERRSLRIAAVLHTISIILTFAFAATLLRTIRHYTKLLEERAAELDRFAVRVTHDILGPISGVDMAIELCERRPGMDEVAERFLGQARASIRQVQGMVRALLDFARSGAQPKSGSRAYPEVVLRTLLDELRPLFTERAIEVGVRAETSAPIACAPGVLASLLSNLLRNSVKYMGDGERRRITVRVLERDDTVRVEVEDTGTGVQPELIPCVFDWAVRGNATRPGLGIGLATVKRLTEAHGGSVGVDSDPGAGSIFWFELPRAPFPTAQAGA
jgi:signal transduction histidine kinase